jgi:dUTPase
VVAGIVKTEEAAGIDLSAEQDKGTVSRIHVMIARTGNHFEIEDLNSANGTVNRFPGFRQPATGCN